MNNIKVIIFNDSNKSINYQSDCEQQVFQQSLDHVYNLEPAWIMHETLQKKWSNTSV